MQRSMAPYQTRATPERLSADGLEAPLRSRV
jgi:hypothetical protein